MHKNKTDITRVVLTRGQARALEDYLRDLATELPPSKWVSPIVVAQNAKNKLGFNISKFNVQSAAEVMNITIPTVRKRPKKYALSTIALTNTVDMLLDKLGEAPPAEFNALKQDIAEFLKLQGAATAV